MARQDARWKGGLRICGGPREALHGLVVFVAKSPLYAAERRDSFLLPLIIIMHGGNSCDARVSHRNCCHEPTGYIWTAVLTPHRLPSTSLLASTIMPFSSPAPSYDLAFATVCSLTLSRLLLYVTPALELVRRLRGPGARSRSSSPSSSRPVSALGLPRSISPQVLLLFLSNVGPVL